MKRYLADTFAMIVFSTVCGAFIEIVIAGLSIDQSMRIRIAAIPIILFAGRPYGLYRDWLFKLLGGNGNEVGELKSTVIDTFANFSFQITLGSDFAFYKWCNDRAGVESWRIHRGIRIHSRQTLWNILEWL